MQNRESFKGKHKKSKTAESGKRQFCNYSSSKILIHFCSYCKSEKIWKIKNTLIFLLLINILNDERVIFGDTPIPSIIPESP